jgi:hypothetical protein
MIVEMSGRQNGWRGLYFPAGGHRHLWAREAILNSAATASQEAANRRPELSTTRGTFAAQTVLSVRNNIIITRYKLSV